MHEINLMEAFASYKVKPSTRSRSAVTPDGALVVSCWYTGFKKVDVEILRYEEDLSSETGGLANALRAHVQEALTGEYEVRLIVAVETGKPKTAEKKLPEAAVPLRKTYHARKDLVGHVTAFDGQRFVIDFRRTAVPVREKASKGSGHKRLAS